jgi:hypothetical protein
MSNNIRVENSDDLRSLLIAAARAVIDGKLNVQRANAVASLSAEVHKSIRLEMVGKALSDKSMAIENGRLVEFPRIEGNA